MLKDTAVSESSDILTWQLDPSKDLRSVSIPCKLPAEVRLKTTDGCLCQNTALDWIHGWFIFCVWGFEPLVALENNWEATNWGTIPEGACNLRSACLALI